MWPFIPWNDIDWHTTGVMGATLAAVGALITSQVWSVLNNKAQAKWRLADLKMNTLNRVTDIGAKLVGLLTSHAMLEDNGVASGVEFVKKVREIEELKFVLLLELEKYGNASQALKEAVASLTGAKTTKEIYAAAADLMAYLATLVNFETAEISKLTHGKRIAI